MPDNISQYSRRNSDNASDGGGAGFGDSSFQHNKSFQKKSNKKLDKKKVLPTKKFPELKLMINGEGRNSNSTFSSDEDNLNVSPLNCAWSVAVPSHQEDPEYQRQLYEACKRYSC